MILTTSLSPSYESCWTTKRDGPGGGRDVLTAVLTDELARLAEGGVAVIVGTHDTNRVPEMVRGWGVRVLPDRQQIESGSALPPRRESAATALSRSDHERRLPRTNRSWRPWVPFGAGSEL